jgi:hypothetical protein
MLLLSFLLLALPRVAIQSPETGLEHAMDRALASCRAAIGDRCVAASDEAEVDYRATIVLRDTVLVVTLRRTGGQTVGSRELEFSPSDTEDQRWVAAGLIVAALTAEQPEAPAPEPGPPAPVGSSGPAETAPRRPALLVPSLDFGGLVGQGLDGGSARIGATSRGSILFRPVHLGPTLSLRTAGAASDPSVAWFGGSIGLAGRVVPFELPWTIELMAELTTERARARARRDDRQDSVASSWRGGGRFGCLAAYRIADWFSPWVAADATLLRPELEIRVEDRPVAHEGPVRWAFSLGGRFYLNGPSD